MDSAQEMATQVVLDVLALRGPSDGSTSFRMVTLSPDQWPAERLRLARKFEKLVPAGAVDTDANIVALKIAPYLHREVSRADYFSGGGGDYYFRG
jgi:hypothetical protein